MEPLRRAAVALVALALSVGCAPITPPPVASGTPPPVPSPSPTPTRPSVTWRDGQTVPIGGHRLGVGDGDVEAHQGWRDVRLTVDDDERIGLVLDAPTWRIVSGVVTLDDDAFITRPVATDADGTRTAASFEAGERGPVLRIDPEARRPVEVAFLVGEALVEGSEWESPTRILITPTALARALASADPVAAAAFAPSMLAQVGDDPRLTGPSMLNQLACHLVGARDKPTWNLETGRPDKGLVGFMAARCN